MDTDLSIDCFSLSNSNINTSTEPIRSPSPSPASASGTLSLSGTTATTTIHPFKSNQYNNNYNNSNSNNPHSNSNNNSNNPTTTTTVVNNDSDKFLKKLSTELNRLDKPYRNSFVDYERLRKQIKKIVYFEAAENEILSTEAELHSINSASLSSSIGRMNRAHEMFWCILKSEMDRVNIFFLNKESQCNTIFDSLNLESNLLANNNQPVHPLTTVTFAKVLIDTFPAHAGSVLESNIHRTAAQVPINELNLQQVQLFQRYLTLCFELDQLRKYVVLNYIILWKIVKKYDKHTNRDSNKLFIDILNGESFASNKVSELLSRAHNITDRLLNKQVDTGNNNNNNNNNSNNSLLCPLCNNSTLDRPSSIQLNCSHKFCFDCITRQSCFGSACPICKTEYEIDTHNYSLSIDSVLTRFNNVSIQEQQPQMNYNTQHPIHTIQQQQLLLQQQQQQQQSTDSLMTPMGNNCEFNLLSPTAVSTPIGHLTLPVTSPIGLISSKSESDSSTISSEYQSAPGLTQQQSAMFLKHFFSNSFKPKRGQGVSCHQCKTTKDPQYLLFCTNRAEKNIRKRRCRKKYCESCLKRSYSAAVAEAIRLDPNRWKCPSCLSLCICAACQRRDPNGECEAEAEADNDGELDDNNRDVTHSPNSHSDSNSNSTPSDESSADGMSAPVKPAGMNGIGMIDSNSNSNAVLAAVNAVEVAGTIIKSESLSITTNESIATTVSPSTSDEFQSNLELSTVATTASTLNSDSLLSRRLINSNSIIDDNDSSVYNSEWESPTIKTRKIQRGVRSLPAGTGAGAGAGGTLPNHLNNMIPLISNNSITGNSPSFSSFTTTPNSPLSPLTSIPQSPSESPRGKSPRRLSAGGISHHHTSAAAAAAIAAVNKSILPQQQQQQLSLSTPTKTRTIRGGGNNSSLTPPQSNNNQPLLPPKSPHRPSGRHLSQVRSFNNNNNNNPSTITAESFNNSSSISALNRMNAAVNIAPASLNRSNSGFNPSNNNNQQQQQQQQPILLSPHMRSSSLGNNTTVDNGDSISVMQQLIESNNTTNALINQLMSTESVNGDNSNIDSDDLDKVIGLYLKSLPNNNNQSASNQQQLKMQMQHHLRYQLLQKQQSEHLRTAANNNNNNNSTGTTIIENTSYKHKAPYGSKRAAKAQQQQQQQQLNQSSSSNNLYQLEQNLAQPQALSARHRSKSGPSTAPLKALQRQQHQQQQQNQSQNQNPSQFDQLKQIEQQQYLLQQQQQQLQQQYQAQSHAIQQQQQHQQQNHAVLAQAMQSRPMEAISVNQQQTAATAPAPQLPISELLSKQPSSFDSLLLPIPDAGFGDFFSRQLSENFPRAISNYNSINSNHNNSNTTNNGNNNHSNNNNLFDSMFNDLPSALLLEKQSSTISLNMNTHNNNNNNNTINTANHNNNNNNPNNNNNNNRSTSSNNPLTDDLLGDLSLPLNLSHSQSAAGGGDTDFLFKELFNPEYNPNAN